MSKFPSRGLKPFAQIAAPQIDPLLAKAGFAAREVVNQWPSIIGGDLAKRTAPLRIDYPRQKQQGDDAPDPGTLVIRVEAPFALEVQHMSDQIIERVNAYIGWRCISRIRLNQAPLTAKKRVLPRSGPGLDKVRVKQMLDQVEDAGLRAALARLGKAIDR